MFTHTLRVLVGVAAWLEAGIGEVLRDRRLERALIQRAASGLRGQLFDDDADLREPLNSAPGPGTEDRAAAFPPGVQASPRMTSARAGAEGAAALAGS